VEIAYMPDKKVQKREIWADRKSILTAYVKTETSKGLEKQRKVKKLKNIAFAFEIHFLLFQSSLNKSLLKT
jgi:hypothetical protein